MTFLEPVSGATLTVKGGIFPMSVDYQDHQLVGESIDGDVKVRTRQIRQNLIRIELNETDTYFNICLFFSSFVVWRLKPITFTPDSGVDVGAGDGVAVTARFWNSQIEGVRESDHRVKYVINLLVMP